MEKPWKVIAAFVGVFIAGAVFGGLLSLRVSKQRQMELQQATLVQLQNQLREQAVQPVPQTSTPTPATTPPVQGQPVAVAPKPTPPPAQPLPVSMAVQAPGLMRRYVDKLDLTPEQKDRIHPLIKRASQDLSRQQQTNLRETGIILQHLQEDISKELSPAQRKVIEEMAERQRVFIEQRERKQQELMRQIQAEKQEKRATGEKPKENIKKPAGKPPEDGN
jgi:Spy/CpxP family protein refolding chaperone